MSAAFIRSPMLPFELPKDKKGLLLESYQG